MARGLTLILCAALAVSACSRLKQDERLRFDGEFFRIKASKTDRDDRSLFEVKVGGARASIVGALEAGRFGGTEYCIENFGTSVIKWTNGPDQAPEAVVLSGDALILTGQCKP